MKVKVENGKLVSESAEIEFSKGKIAFRLKGEKLFLESCLQVSSFSRNCKVISIESFNSVENKRVIYSTYVFEIPTEEALLEVDVERRSSLTDGTVKRNFLTKVIEKGQ